MLQTIKIGKLEYLVSTLIETPHCFSTRFGGVSEGYLSSLNLGVHRGDLHENCVENYRLLGEAVGFTPEDVVFSHQIHSTRVDRVTAADRGFCLREGVTAPSRDGMITNEPHVAMAVFGADCPTILLFDPDTHSAAAVHAGWRGAAAVIAAEAVRRMTGAFGCRPETIRAAIGPCIGPCCFETHADVPEAVLATVGEEASSCIRPLGKADEKGEKYSVDLRALNVLHLHRAGVSAIDICPCCTACEPDRFWSHRVSKGVRGSQAAIIVLE